MIDTRASRLGCAVLLALGSLAIGVDRAGAEDGPQRVLVIPMSGAVPGVPDSAAQITQVVARASGLTGAEVTVGEVGFEDAAALAGCAEQTAACFAKVAEALQVDELVVGTISTSDDGAQVVVALTLFEGGQIRTRSLSFPAGDMQAIVEGLARDVPGMFLGAEPGPEPEPKPKPEPEPEPPPPPPPPRDTGFSLGRVGWSSWLITGAGAAMAGAGAVFVLEGKDRQDQIDRAPIRTADDFERLAELEDEGDRYLKIGSGLLIGGAAVIVTGAVLIALDGRAGDEAPPPAVSVAPVPVEGGAALSLSVRLP